LSELMSSVSMLNPTSVDRRCCIVIRSFSTGHRIGAVVVTVAAAVVADHGTPAAGLDESCMIAVF